MRGIKSYGFYIIYEYSNKKECNNAILTQCNLYLDATLFSGKYSTFITDASQLCTTSVLLVINVTLPFTSEVLVALIKHRKCSSCAIIH